MNPPVAKAAPRIVAPSGAPAETEALGERLAQALPDGVVVGLVGPLGAGKTCLVRGMARALGIEDSEVTSPSFVYLVSYGPGGGDLPLLHHGDLFRIPPLDDGAMERALAEIGLFAAMEDACPAVVEWWERFRGPLPEALVVVEFVIENTEHRSISLEFQGSRLARAAARMGAA